MSKKILAGIIILIVIAGLAGGGYAIFHKSSKKQATTAAQNNNAYTSSNTPSHTTSSVPVNNTIVITKTKPGIGQYLANPKGMTLYTYNGDTANTSNCTGSCLAIWPAYVDTGSTTGLPVNFGVIKRKDNGQMQFTYKGLPLYFYVGDKQAGQVTGNGITGFYVAKP